MKREDAKRARQWRDEQAETLNFLCGDYRKGRHPDWDKLWDIAVHVPGHVIEEALAKITSKVCITKQLARTPENEGQINSLYFRILGELCKKKGISKDVAKKMSEEYSRKTIINEWDSGS